MNHIIDIKNGLDSDDLEVIEIFKKVLGKLGDDLRDGGYITEIITNFSSAPLGQKELRVRLIDGQTGRNMLVGLTLSAEMFWWTFDGIYTASRTGYTLEDRKEIIEEFKEDVISMVRNKDFKEIIYELGGRSVYKELYFNKGGVMSKSLVPGGGIIKRFTRGRKA